MDEIAKWRNCIDSIDSEIVKMISERAKCAMEIGKLKQKMGMQVYNAGREKEVLEKVEKLNEGPLSGKSLKKIFTNIIEACREIEKE